VVLLLERLVLQTHTTTLKAKLHHPTTSSIQPRAALVAQLSNPIAKPPIRNLQVPEMESIMPRHLNSSKVQSQTPDHQVSNPPLTLILIQVCTLRAQLLQLEPPVLLRTK
jgi:hypothetical protein